MVWILVVIAVVFAWIFLRFLMDFNKQRSVIAAKGGIKTIYKSLIDGLLEYRSARTNHLCKKYSYISQYIVPGRL